jgi:hypothetical protein
MRLRQGQQVLYKHTLNAPLWNIGFQVGINESKTLSERFELSVGGRIQLRGDKKGTNLIYPYQDTVSLRLYYLLFPVNIRYKLLKSENIYFQLGISPDFLLAQKKVGEGTNLIPEGNGFGITGQTGFKFCFNKKYAFEAMYSQSVISFYTADLGNSPIGPTLKYFHQAFELTLIRSFNEN